MRFLSGALRQTFRPWLERLSTPVKLPQRLRPSSWGENEGWGALTLVLLVGYVIAFLATFRDYGLTWDEGWHAIYGGMIVDWYRSGFENRAALEYKDLVYYGGLFDVLGRLLARFSPLDLFETRHLLSGFFGTLGLLYAYRLATYLATPSAGFLASLFLVLTPIYYGHAFNNPKDIPFATLFLVALYYLIRTIRHFPAIPWPLTLRLGIAVGGALGVRFAGILLIGYFVLAFLAWFTVRACTRAPDVRWLSAMLSYATRLLAVVATAWLVMLVWWPAAQAHPIWHLVKTWRVVGNVPWANTVLFGGRDILASELPWDYLPRTALLTLPEFLLFALLIGCVSGVRRVRVRDKSFLVSARALEVGLLAFAAVFPAVYATVAGATQFDGLRHFLFLIPILTVLAGVGVIRFVKDQSGRAAIACRAVLAVGMAATAIDMVELHPHQYVYFNRLIAGGLRGAAGSYETDYWGNSYREGVEWVVSHYGSFASPTQPIRVASCSNPLSTRYFLRSAHFRYVYLAEEPADVFLATTRWHCDEAVAGRVVHRVQRQGVTLLYVKELDKSAAEDSDARPSAPVKEGGLASRAQ
jgi:hypothetical protein